MIKPGGGDASAFDPSGKAGARADGRRRRVERTVGREGGHMILRRTLCVAKRIYA